MRWRQLAIFLGFGLGFGCDSEPNCHDSCTHGESTSDATSSNTTDDHETHVHTQTDSDATAGEVSGSASDTGSDSDTTEGPGAPTSMDYCDCMLVACHDYYHDHWGDDHDNSLVACLAEAEAVPSAGMEVMEGNFFECRFYHCEQAYSEPERCTEAAGMGMCQ